MSGSILDIYLPMKSIMLSPSNPKEFSLKTAPSASKTDIKRTLKMLGFEVEKVRTLNMQGKKKGRGARLVTKPNYKKAYVTLRNPQGKCDYLGSKYKCCNTCNCSNCDS